MIYGEEGERLEGGGAFGKRGDIMFLDEDKGGTICLLMKRRG